MSENLSKTSATPKLTIDSGSKETPGLRLTYVAPPRWSDYSLLAALLLGVAITALGPLIFFSGDTLEWWGFAPLLLGLLVTGGALLSLRRIQRGFRIQYRVSVKDGQVTFTHNDESSTLARAKLGRMWISRQRANGQVRSVEISAYYDGSVTTIFNITEISRLLGEDDNLLLTHIVAYLNAPGKVGRRKREETATIQLGYRSDYAVATPLTARRLTYLAPRATRLLYAAGIALFMLLCHFARYYFNLDWPVESWTGTVHAEALISVAGFIITPWIYSCAAKKIDACPCCYDSLGVIFWSPHFAALAAFLMLGAIYYVSEAAHVQLRDLVITAVLLALMTGMIYRFLSGCSCGAQRADQGGR